uniref:Uncharacterized protein n=1 Tax=Cacopsylla melanoneura TaxID=428564 RepID=A0A8D8RG22_9HEMI
MKNRFGCFFFFSSRRGRTRFCRDWGLDGGPSPPPPLFFFFFFFRGGGGGGFEPHIQPPLITPLIKTALVWQYTRGHIIKTALIVKPGLARLRDAGFKRENAIFLIIVRSFSEQFHEMNPLDSSSSISSKKVFKRHKK